MAKKFKKTAWTKEQQTKFLKKRFGTNVNYVEATVPMAAFEVEEIFGKMCEEYEPLCGCCSAWLEWNKTGKVTVTLERNEIIKWLTE